MRTLSCLTLLGLLLAPVALADIPPPDSGSDTDEASETEGDSSCSHLGGGAAGSLGLILLAAAAGRRRR